MGWGALSYTETPTNIKEPISLDIDEARELGNNLIVASWLLAVTTAAKNKGQGGSLSALLGIGDMLDDE